MTNWLDEMESEASKGGKFLKFAENDQKVIEILTDPVKGQSRFSWPDGNPKTEFKLDVRQEGTMDVVVWAITNKDVMQQLLGIAKTNGLPSLVGCKISVAVRKTGEKSRAWFLQMLSRPQGQGMPGNATAGFPAAKVEGST